MSAAKKRTTKKVRSTRTVSKKRKSTKKSVFAFVKKLGSKGLVNRKFLIFLISFAVIGGGYLAYRSFADVGPLGASGEFTAVNPARILDTRDGTGGISKPLGQGQTQAVQVTGRGGIPTSNVKAVVMNVTVTGGTASSFLTVWPSGQINPGTSNLNFAAGQTIPNQVTVKVGADGKVQMYNPAGNVHVIFDVAGYYSDAKGNGGARFNSLAPARILDTRDGTGGVSTPVGQTAVPVQITGRGGVPSSGAKAVVMNVTVTGATANSNLTIWPSNVARPNTSNLNFAAGQTIPNQVTAKLGSDGKVNVYSSSGTTNVIFDVAGYYADSSNGSSLAGRFVPLDKPVRLLDTRDVATGQVKQAAYPVRVNGQAGWPTIPDVSGVVMNATVTAGTTSSFLTVWPSDSAKPNTSSVNFAAGQTIPNQVTTKVGKDGYINIANAGGSVHVILDVAGYFAKDSTAKDRLDLAPSDLGTQFSTGPQPKVVSDTFDGSTFDTMEIPPHGPTTTQWPGLGVQASKTESFMTANGQSSSLRQCVILRAVSGTGKVRLVTMAGHTTTTDPYEDVQIPSTSYGEVCGNWVMGTGTNSTNTPVWNSGTVALRVKRVSLLADSSAAPVVYRALADDYDTTYLNGANQYTETDGTTSVVVQPVSNAGFGFKLAYSSTFFGQTTLYKSRSKIFCANVKSPAGPGTAMLLASGAKGWEYVPIAQSNTYSKICSPTPLDTTVIPAIGSAIGGKPIYVKSIQVEIR